MRHRRLKDYITALFNVVSSSHTQMRTSVADPEGGPPSRSGSQKQKNDRRNMVYNASFKASDFKIFRGSMPRTPLEHMNASCGVKKFLQ